MMNQIAFIIDDSLVNSDDVLSEHHYLINLPITDFTNVNAPIEHDQKCPISFDELTLKVQNNHDLKTSAIVLGEADALLNELLAKYEKIVIIGISPKLSSSYHN